MDEKGLMKAYEKLLRGKYITIYVDPITKKEVEGQARVRQVMGAIASTMQEDEVRVLCHFKGDDKFMLVERFIIMRRLFGSKEPAKLPIDNLEKK